MSTGIGYQMKLRNWRTKKMFDKFGEFDSYAEINMAAKGFLEEGDFESIKELAVEI